MAIHMFHIKRNKLKVMLNVQLVVADMKTTAEYPVTGTGKRQLYFPCQ